MTHLERADVTGLSVGFGEAGILGVAVISAVLSPSNMTALFSAVIFCAVELIETI